MDHASQWFGPVLWAPLLSMLVAQALKPVFDLVSARRWQPGRAFDTGGMPSSHTALVTTLTLAVARVEGTSSSVFSVVLIFSLYFVFEATGLRQEVGHQARLLNDMADELVRTHHLPLDAARLRELVGHTWTEVLGGAAVGTVVFFLLRHRIPSA